MVVTGLERVMQNLTYPGAVSCGVWRVAIQLIADEPQPQPQQPHAHDSQRGSRIVNGETNGAESHYQSINGDSLADGVD